jgi:hypothetical protein
MKCAACPVTSGDCIVESTNHVRFCAWAASGRPEYIAEILDLSANGWPPDQVATMTIGAPVYPPLSVQARNLAGTLWSWAKDGFKIASSSVVMTRRSICRLCDKFDHRQQRCTVCGCRDSVKPYLKAAECPLKKW